MRVLIIGGTGFIGQLIVRALVENEHEVRVFHRGSTTAALPPSVSHIHGERAELPHFAPVFRAWAPDVVLDTFAYDRDDLAIVHRATGEIPCRFVILSSMDVYRAYAIYCRLGVRAGRSATARAGLPGTSSQRQGAIIKGTIRMAVESHVCRERGGRGRPGCRCKGQRVANL